MKRTRAILFGITMLTVSGCGNLVMSGLYPGADTDDKITPPSSSAFVLRTATRPDGELRVYYAREIPNARASLVYLHGNAALTERSLSELGARLSPTQTDIYITEYTGYAGNSGTPSQRELINDALTVIAQARADNPNQPIILFGLSMGGALALQVAASTDVDALITDAAFTSTAALAPEWVNSYLLRDNTYDGLRAATRIKTPWQILHCDNDPAIPSAMATELLQANGLQSTKLSIIDCNMHAAPAGEWQAAINQAIENLRRD